MQLVYGGGQIDRVVEDAEARLGDFREKDSGYAYLIYEPVTSPHHLFPEDLAVTLMFNSRASALAARSLAERGRDMPLDSLPNKRLEHTTDAERVALAELIASMARWPGFGASLATKTLHKKRPELIPVLDNQAIFGAYMNRMWPQHPSKQDTEKSSRRIKQALDWIVYDLNRAENADAWPRLQGNEPGRSLIEIFDMIWWMYFRMREPVRS